MIVHCLPFPPFPPSICPYHHFLASLDARGWGVLFYWRRIWHTKNVLCSVLLKKKSWCGGLNKEHSAIMSLCSVNNYRMFFVRTSTPTPGMHRKLIEHGKCWMQINQLLTRSPGEWKDNSIWCGCTLQEIFKRWTSTQCTGSTEV